MMSAHVNDEEVEHPALAGVSLTPSLESVRPPFMFGLHTKT